MATMTSLAASVARGDLGGPAPNMKLSIRTINNDVKNLIINMRTNRDGRLKKNNLN